MFEPVFLTSANRPQQFLEDEGREVAFAGRSNSGKSSAINAVLGVRGLARTSKTPGRTQLVNFFAVAPDRRLVDLPGYGYARVAPAVQAHWQRLLEEYFRRRRSLSGLVVTIDIRRGFAELDAQMLAWSAPLGLPALLLLTKADKLPRSKVLAQCRTVARAAPPDAAVIAFSAKDGRGVGEARARLAAWLDLGPGSTRWQPT